MQNQERYIIDLKQKKLYNVDLINYHRFSQSSYYKCYKDFNEAKKALEILLMDELSNVKSLLEHLQAQDISNLKNIAKEKASLAKERYENEQARINSIHGLSNSELIKALTFAFEDIYLQDKQANLKSCSFEDLLTKYDIRILARKDFSNLEDFKLNALKMYINGDIRVLRREEVIKALQSMKQDYKIEIRLFYK